MLCKMESDHDYMDIVQFWFVPGCFPTVIAFLNFSGIMLRSATPFYGNNVNF